MVTLARALDMKYGRMYDRDLLCHYRCLPILSGSGLCDLDGSLLIANDRFKGMEVVKGKITLPDLPGIGVVKL